MDFSVRMDQSTLGSTACIELVPGQYDGQHWREGSLFVSEDAFGMAEGIIARHFARFDHMGPNEIPKEVGTRIVEEWRSAAVALRDLEPQDAAAVLDTSVGYGDEDVLETLETQRTEIAEMLRAVATWVDQAYEQFEYVTVLGI